MLKMEDDNGLELRLGLSCGGSTNLPKGNLGSTSDANAKSSDDDRGSKLIDDFKNFLEGGTPNHEAVTGTQRIDLVKVEENFFNNLSKATVDVGNSKSSNSAGFWVANDGSSTEVVDEKRPDVGDKRKSLFPDPSQQKKREAEAHRADLHDKKRTSHISITTDDGSTAENEDVADSEAEGPTSKLVSQHDDGSKRPISATGSSEVHKGVHGISDSRAVELPGQKMFKISGEREIKFGNMPYGVQVPSQPVGIMNMPYSRPLKDTNPSSIAGTSSYPIPGMMQVVATANSDRSGLQPVMPANLPLMFRYSTVQLPAVDKDNSHSPMSHQQLFPSYARGPPNSDKHNDGQKALQVPVPVSPHNQAEPSQYDGRVLERGRGQNNGEGVSSSHAEDDVKRSNMIFSSKEATDQPKAEGFPSEFPAIRPGIAADLKFGGSGSYPNLPWVSTTGPGPNGKTISGVTYKYSPTQIRIVCACHGTHMSPEEFTRHASDGPGNPDGVNGITSFSNGNPAASAQS